MKDILLELNSETNISDMECSSQKKEARFFARLKANEFINSNGSPIDQIHFFATFVTIFYA